MRVYRSTFTGAPRVLFLCSVPVHRPARHVLPIIWAHKLEGLPGRTGTIEVAELMRPPICLGQEGLFTMKQWDFTYSHLQKNGQSFYAMKRAPSPAGRRGTALTLAFRIRITRD